MHVELDSQKTFSNSRMGLCKYMLEIWHTCSATCTSKNLSKFFEYLAIITASFPIHLSHIVHLLL